MSVHTIAANSLALEACGYTKDTPQPEGAEIGHYDDGELNGMLYENGALQPMLKTKPPLTDEQHVESLELIGQRLNSFGITSAIDANLNFKQLHIYNDAKKQGKLTYRANLMFYLDPQFGSFEENMRRIEEMGCVTGFGDDMLKLNGCKVTLDGITAAFTAAMKRREYRQRPGFYGDTIYTQEEIDALVCKATEFGWQFGIHTIGDMSEDRALHAFQEANKIRPVKELRHYLIHYQLPYEDQWPIMQELGVGVCLQPTLVSQMGEEPLFWPEQVERFQSPGPAPTRRLSPATRCLACTTPSRAWTRPRARRSPRATSRRSRPSRPSSCGRRTPRSSAMTTTRWARSRWAIWPTSPSSIATASLRATPRTSATPRSRRPSSAARWCTRRKGR